MFLLETTNYTVDHSEYAGQYTPDMAGSLQIALESARDWHNLEMKMIRAEHTAIVTEDAPLMEAAVGDFFSRAKEWFIKLWKKVKEFFSRLFEHIRLFFTNAKTFLSKYEKDLRNIQDNQMKVEMDLAVALVAGQGKAKTNDINTYVGHLEPITSAVAEVIKAEDLEKKVGKTPGEAKEELLKRESTKLTRAIVGHCLDFLRAEGDVQKALTAAQKDFDSKIKKAIDACNGKENQEKDNVGFTKAVQSNQVIMSTYNSYIGVLAKVCATYAAEALSACKKAYKSRPAKNYGPKYYEDKKSESAGILDRF